LLETGDRFALFFAGVHNEYCRVRLPSGARRMCSQAQKLSLFDDCRQRLLTHSLEDRLIPNPVCFLDAEHVAITTCSKRTRVWKSLPWSVTMTRFYTVGSRDRFSKIMQTLRCSCNFVDRKIVFVFQNAPQPVLFGLLYRPVRRPSSTPGT